MASGEWDGGRGEWERPHNLSGFWAVGLHAPCSGSGLYAQNMGSHWFQLGPGCRDHMCHLWVGIGGPSHHTQGQDMGTICILHRAGMWDLPAVLRGRPWDPHMVLRVRMLGSLIQCGDTGTFMLGSRCAAPYTALGVTGGICIGAGTWGSQHGAWDEGMETPALGLGCRGPHIRVRARIWGPFYWGWDEGTLVSGPGLGLTCTEDWGPPYGDCSIS